MIIVGSSGIPSSKFYILITHEEETYFGREVKN